MIKKRWRISCLAILCALLLPLNSIADEGMWLPFLLSNQKYKEMKRAGLKLSKKDIADINKTCLTKSIVGLVNNGPDLTHSFATGSLVSKDGLVLTNFHCVMRQMGRLSLQANYDFLKYGYWSKDQKEESLCRDLYVKQLLRIEDITDKMLEGTKGLEGRAFTMKVNKNGHALFDEVMKAEKAKGERGIQIKFQSLYANNQYIMSVYRLYKDVRLVAAPPQMVGMYGGTGDNWLYPRYTADFALLRIYVNKENKPANYRQTNIPFQTSSYLKIADKPAKEGDFVMAMGYPGSTKQFVPSFGIEGAIESSQVGLNISEKRIKIIEEEMKNDPSIHARYFPVLSSISNRYLKWKGLLNGMRTNDVVAKKQKEEQEFLAWCKKDNSRKKYADAYQTMKKQYPLLSAYRLSKDYFNYSALSGPEIIAFIGKFEKLVAMHTSTRRKLNLRREASEAKRLEGLTNQFFQDWSYNIDKNTFREVLLAYYKNMPSKFHSPETVELIKEYDGNIDKLVEEAFETSLFTHPNKVLDYLAADKERDIKVITNDMLYEMSIGFYKVYIQKINRQLQSLQSKQTQPYRTYMQGYLEMNKENKNLWPDANNSLRISYGHITNASPEAGVTYRWYTDTKGLLERAKIHKGNPEYKLSKRYHTLLNKGNRKVCFLNDSQTSSGSSGSPILNSRGEIVGLNFDRMWQSVVSDYDYDGKGRSISTDINYVKWIIHEYAKRNYLP